MQKIRNASLDKIVRATAGAGKTTGLIKAVEECFKRHFQKTGSAPHILLTTFTIKAANELSERLLEYALHNEDKGFLDFVGSHYLDVGTMHSTFMKVQAHISSENSDDDKSVLESFKYNEARKIVHEVFVEQDAAELFEYIGTDDEVVQIFFKMFEQNHLKLHPVILEQFQESIRKNILMFMDNDNEYSGQIKDVLGNFTSTELFWEDINKLRSLLTEKLSNKCKRDERAFYKKILKNIEIPEARKEFAEKYISLNETFFVCYQEWRVKYEKSLRENLGFGISDIEWRLLNELEGKGEELDLWDYCFFDEYQDTSPIQKKIISYLTKSTPCYIVGDPFQSIYYFRGARKDIFLNDFDKISSDGGEVTFRLDNYRSAPEIVDFVNIVCANLLSDFKGMTSQRDEKGYIEVFYSPEANIDDELNYVYSKLKDVDLEKESFAIMSRNAKELMRCGKFLKEKGVSASLSLSKSFENSLEIIDLCGILMFMGYPHDDNNFVNLLRSPWFESDDETIKKLWEQSKKENVSLWSVFQKEFVDSFFLKLLIDYENYNCNEVLVNFLGYSEFLNSTDHLDVTGKREQNIWKFIEILQVEEESPQFTISAFINDILTGLYPFEKDSSEPKSGCVLMTVHASKGLQFDHVALLGMNKTFSTRSGQVMIDEQTGLFGVRFLDESNNKRVFPAYFEKTMSRDKKELAEESRRLFYVALTRAKSHLYLAGSGEISKNPFEPSWMKSIMDLKEKLIFNEVSDIAAPQNESVKIEDPFGFLLNRLPQETHKKKSTAVTKNIDEDLKNHQSSSQKDLSWFSRNITRGTLFHEFVERSTVNGVERNAVNNFFDNEAEQNYHALNFLYEQQDFPFEQLMIHGEREWGFDYIDEEESFFSGKIDLWGKIDDEIWIVDFKTGQDRYLEKGFKQLEFYAKVLKRFLENQQLKIKLVLSFPFLEKTVIRQMDMS